MKSAESPNLYAGLLKAIENHLAPLDQSHAIEYIQFTQGRTSVNGDASLCSRIFSSEKKVTGF
jgi:hypothetical protein